MYKFFYPIIIVFLSSILGYSLTLSFGSDYTFYFVTSDFLNDSRIIYDDFFTHKGPIYFVFLFIVKQLFGTGYIGYHFGFIFTLILFGLVFYYVIKYRSPKINNILIISIFVSLFFFQNSNSSIQFFLTSFLLLFIVNLEKYILRENHFNLIYSSIFLSLAFLTRIDALIYLVIPLIVFFQIKKEKKISFMLFQVFIPILIYVILKLFLDFSHINFYEHNIEFNFLYGKKDLSFLKLIRQLVYRVDTFILLCSSGLILYLQKIIKFKLSVDYLFVLVSLFLFISTLSDKDYHSLILIVPLFYFVSNKIKNKDYRFLIISFICSFFVMFKSLGIIINSKKLSNEFIDNKDLMITKDKDFKNNSLIYGGIPSINFYTRNLNHQSINNWWLYKEIGFDKNEKLIENHKKGLNSEVPFYVHYHLYENPEPNKWTLELLENTVILEKIGNFYKVKKK